VTDQEHRFLKLLIDKHGFYQILQELYRIVSAYGRTSVLWRNRASVVRGAMMQVSITDKQIAL
jgi:hypothetical protein